MEPRVRAHRFLTVLQHMRRRTQRYISLLAMQALQMSGSWFQSFCWSRESADRIAPGSRGSACSPRPSNPPFSSEKRNWTSSEALLFYERLSKLSTLTDASLKKSLHSLMQVWKALYTLMQDWKAFYTDWHKSGKISTLTDASLKSSLYSDARLKSFPHSLTQIWKARRCGLSWVIHGVSSRLVVPWSSIEIRS